MDKTPNYSLSQWARSDQVRMEDFNADNAKIDAALKAEADARTALAAEVAKCGNCTIEVFTYYGTGKYGPQNPTVITFPRMPTAFMILGSEGTMFGQGGHSAIYGCMSANSTTQAQARQVTWSGNTISFYDSYDSTQMNSGGIHLVIAFYAES